MPFSVYCKIPTENRGRVNLLYYVLASKDSLNTYDIMDLYFPGGIP